MSKSVHLPPTSYEQIKIDGFAHIRKMCFVNVTLTEKCRQILMMLRETQNLSMFTISPF